MARNGSTAENTSTQASADPAEELKLAPYGRKADGTPRLRNVASGPRTRKPVHVLARVMDAQGNELKDVTLQVVIATNDTEKLLEAQDKNPGVQRFKITFGSNDEVAAAS